MGTILIGAFVTEHRLINPSVFPGCHGSRPVRKHRYRRFSIALYCSPLVIHLHPWKKRKGGGGRVRISSACCHGEISWRENKNEPAGCAIVCYFFSERKYIACPLMYVLLFFLPKFSGSNPIAMQYTHSSGSWCTFSSKPPTLCRRASEVYTAPSYGFLMLWVHWVRDIEISIIQPPPAHFGRSSALPLKKESHFLRPLAISHKSISIVSPSACRRYIAVHVVCFFTRSSIKNRVQKISTLALQ